MAADTSKITVVCPTCDNKMEIPGEKKNTRLECPKCGSAFMAYEAVKCDKCGTFRHPNHKCRNCLTDGERKKTPFSWSDLWSGSQQNDELARKQREQVEQKFRELFDSIDSITGVNEQEEQKFREHVDRIQKDILTLLESEAKKNDQRFEELSERIEAPKDRISELESEIGELKEEEMNSSLETVNGEREKEILRLREGLQQTLDDFEVSGEIVGCAEGPSAVRFEIELAPGVPFAELKEIEDNIVMNCMVMGGIRMLAPIPKRPVCVVEVPLYPRKMVQWQAITESAAWRDSSAELPLAVGATWNDEPVIIDLAQAPHLLLAGAVATGASYCVNAIIAGLISKFRSTDLKLLFVDPAMIQYEEFGKLPHLIRPIVYNAGEMAKALRDVAEEVDRRYELLARHDAKTIRDLNRDTAGHAPLPYLVIVIDDLAELMVAEAKNEIESDILKIACMGSVVGIHLVIVSQQRLDVITDAITATFPTRLCFQVRSKAESLMVLDDAAAVGLLGMGDMLLMRPSPAVIERVQSAIISETDLTKLVDSVCRRESE